MTKMTLTGKFAAAATALGLTLAPAALVAQEATSPEAPQEAPAASFSDEQLNGFVDAAMEVAEIRDAYMPQLQAAESEADAQALQTEARDEMVAAIEATENMDVQTYTQIGESAQTDEALQARLNTMIQDRVTEQGEG
ncbi:DUF4168 domain-containing protein [Ferrimonas balearica]|nr:DUF4168 domain-containing protein [Ferrimonas balearica]